VSEEAREDGLPAAPVDLSGALRASVGDLFRLPRLDRRGILAVAGLVILAWLATSLYRVQRDREHRPAFGPKPRHLGHDP